MAVALAKVNTAMIVNRVPLYTSNHVNGGLQENRDMTEDFPKGKENRNVIYDNIDIKSIKLVC